MELMLYNGGLTSAAHVEGDSCPINKPHCPLRHNGPAHRPPEREARREPSRRAVRRSEWSPLLGAPWNSRFVLKGDPIPRTLRGIRDLPGSDFDHFAIVNDSNSDSRMNRL